MQPQASSSPLFTDLYEVTMAQAYRASETLGSAVFEAFYRHLPPGRAYVVAAGLADVLDFLESLRFGEQDIAYLRSLRLFSDTFLRELTELRFTGDVWAVPEGTLVFPHEPILQVVAPVIEGQLVETFVLNQLHLQCVLATKASRVVEAAQGRAVVEFGARRAHGTDAAMKAARASYLAGAAGTSHLLAARTYGIPAFGTMAHSFVQALGSERAAFALYNRLYPGTTVLVDTYDTLTGVDQVIALARELGADFKVGAVRLDSGDLASLSKAARARLDRAGLQRVQIFASSDLDEHSIADLIAQKSPIDGFGVGTRLSAATDAPTLDMAYKLVEYEGQGRTKLSSQKELYPGRKQVFRIREGGRFVGDVLAHHSEEAAGEPLLVQVMHKGRRVGAGSATLQEARARLQEQLQALPEALRGLSAPEAPYPVQVSERVRGELERLRHAAH
jgi:nicotinate phosphoribosyltransferase